jgi:hypothetical protein
MNLLKNSFIQSVGVAAIAYILLLALGWGIEAILRLIESFSRWYRFYAINWIEEAAIALGIIWFLISAVSSSKDS